MKISNKISRVDIQVSLLAAVIVIVSFTCVYAFNYCVTYRDMIHNLSDNATSIYNYVEKNLDKNTFKNINTKDDQYKQEYISNKKLLADAKELAGVMYLYTAKQAEDGTLIYILDGLPSDSSDFRNAGDVIEKEIWPDLIHALNDNIVMPNDIKPTSWGKIFISYFPIHDNGKVVGVIGIEFNAEHQYNAFQLLRIGTPIIAFISCLIAILLAVKMFKRISNPLYQDFANTDYLTGIKNRNAFEIDMNNLNNSNIKEDLIVLSIDLNGLKIVNDTLGHKSGDGYIKSASQIINKNVPPNSRTYRVGGDEFVVLLKFETIEQVEEIIDTIQKECTLINEHEVFKLSLSIGYALYDSCNDNDIFHAYQIADKLMYQNKKASKIMI